MIASKTLGDLPSHWHTGGVPSPQLGALSALMLGTLPIVSLPVLCLFHSDAFAKLLESGDLSMSSIKVDGINMSFQNLLTKICFHHHFSGKGFDGTGRRESLLTHGSYSAPLGAMLASPTCSCCSCGTSGLLRLPVQPIHPGSPRLPPSEKGEPA